MIVDDFDGEVQDFVGDQIFAIFNKRGDQPDHALRARGPRSSCKDAPQRIAQPGWPTFRCGVNSGPIVAGVVGDRGHRIHGVFGDTVNLGSRLEGQAPPGGIVIGAGDPRRAPRRSAACSALAPLQIKGKARARTRFPPRCAAVRSARAGPSTRARTATGPRPDRRSSAG